MQRQTTMAKPAEVKRAWYLVDATDMPLGRLASQVAQILMGKNKPTYTPNEDTGDFVIIINADKIRVTGTKAASKSYYRHSGFPGGIKDATLAEVREKAPEKIIENAVRVMLPKNKLSADRIERLKVYAGEEHAHTAQKPKKVEVK